MSMIDQLIEQYTKGATGLNKYRKTLDTKDPDQRDEHDIVSGMISDMRYSLLWIKTGRRPGNRRGIERSDVYRQREMLAQMSDKFPDTDKLIMILLTMSLRERMSFLLYFAHGLTYQEISDRLKVSVRAVRTFVVRAKTKVQQGLSE